MVWIWYEYGINMEYLPTISKNERDIQLWYTSALGWWHTRYIQRWRWHLQRGRPCQPFRVEHPQCFPGTGIRKGLVSESSRIEALWHWVCQILSRTCAVILMWDIVGLTMINLKSCPDLTATSLLFKKTDFVSITTCDYWPQVANTNLKFLRWKSTSPKPT